MKHLFLYPSSMNIITIAAIFYPKSLPTLLIIFTIGITIGRVMEVHRTFKEIK